MFEIACPGCEWTGEAPSEAAAAQLWRNHLPVCPNAPDAGDLLAVLLAELAIPDDDLGSLRAAHARAAALKSLLDEVERGGAPSHAAAAATLVAERRLGIALDALEREPGTAGTSAYQQAVHELGVDARTARYWRQVGAIATEAFESYLRPALGGTHRGPPISRAGLMRACSGVTPPALTTRQVVSAWCPECDWDGSESGGHLSLPSMQRRTRAHAVRTGHMTRLDVRYTYLPE